MPPDDTHKMLIIGSNMDVTEIDSYRKLFADLAAFELKQSGQASISSLLPKLYAAEVDLSKERRGYFIMLDDVSPEYVMVDYNKGLSLEQLVASLEGLAHFHAACYAFKQVEGFEKFDKKYDFFSCQNGINS